MVQDSVVVPDLLVQDCVVGSDLLQSLNLERLEDSRGGGGGYSLALVTLKLDDAADDVLQGLIMTGNCQFNSQNKKVVIFIILPECFCI